MNNIENREQELQRQLREIEIEKIRSIAPLLYDYLHDNDFMFEKTNKAFKPFNDYFEIGVTFWQNTSEEPIEILFYDRKKSQIIGNGYFSRFEIFPRKVFLQNEEDLAISFLKNPPMPQKYKITFIYEKEHYVFGTAEDAEKEADSWVGCGWIPDFNINVEPL